MFIWRTLWLLQIGQNYAAYWMKILFRLKLTSKGKTINETFSLKVPNSAGGAPRAELLEAWLALTIG